MEIPFGLRLRAMRGRGGTAGGGAKGGRARAGWTWWLERLLIALLILQLIRLMWALATPVGSFGLWEGRRAQVMPVAARQALFASFDPFFRDGARGSDGNIVVTSLALTVHGIRLNEGSGLGSAIIATPDGVQNSYAVGDEILPGVVLKAVAFDHVTIDRGGAEEQIFMDQSVPAPTAAAPPPGAGSAAGPGMAAAPAPVQNGAPSVDMLKRDIGFAPRMQNGRVTGLAVQSRGPGFGVAGFHPGDIVTQVNGQPVGDMASVQNQIAPGARLSFTVERGAAVASVNLILQDR